MHFANPPASELVEKWPHDMFEADPVPPPRQRARDPHSAAAVDMPPLAGSPPTTTPAADDTGYSTGMCKRAMPDMQPIHGFRCQHQLSRWCCELHRLQHAYFSLVEFLASRMPFPAWARLWQKLFALLLMMVALSKCQPTCRCCSSYSVLVGCACFSASYWPALQGQTKSWCMACPTARRARWSRAAAWLGMQAACPSCSGRSLTACCPWAATPLTPACAPAHQPRGGSRSCMPGVRFVLSSCK